MRIKEIGEFGLIERIARLLPVPPADVIMGIGDDVAVLKTSGPEYLLATCDIQVEGVHFIRDSITPYQLGRKAVAINVSDIAAVGGNPRWVLVSLAIPETTDVSYIEELYLGIREQAALAGASVVGGNLSRMESRIAIDITLLGEIPPEQLMLRNGAKVGDSILVTGYPGESRAGLELIRRPELRISNENLPRLMERHLVPQPRLFEGKFLACSGLVSAMIDISDGLVADLGHICGSSGTGAEIESEKLPVSPALAEAARISGVDGLDWILSGGEDYELLFTASPEGVPDIKKMLLEETGTLCTEIGKITGNAGGLQLRLADGKTKKLSSDKGWDHFGN